MKTKRGTIVQIILIDRTVNVKLIEDEKAEIELVSLSDLEEAFEIIQKDCPWLSKENTYFMMPTGEQGSSFGFIFEVPADKEIPVSYLESE